MPTAKCRSCHKTINFDPKHLGRKCRCPGCGTTVLLANDFEFDFKASEERPAVAPDPGWFYRHEGALAIVDVGPLKKSEVMRDVNHGKISHKTAVWHQIETHGQPVFAESIDWIRDAVSLRNRIELEAKSEAKQARQRANAKIVADAKQVADKASSATANGLIVAGDFLGWIARKPWFWALLLWPLTFYSVLFAYFVFPTLICTWFPAFFDNHRYAKLAGYVLAIASIWGIVNVDYREHIWADDSPSLTKLYVDTYYRWSGSHYRQLTVRSDSATWNAEGWMSKSGKPHGKWTNSLYTKETSSFEVIPIWYWYGEEVTEGQFVLMSKK